MENQVSPSTDHISDVYKVAKFQKYLLVLVLVNLGSVLFARNYIISLAVSVICMYFVYQICAGLKTKYVWLWLVGLLIPIVSLILILIINQKATTLIRRNGFRVGLLGADVNAIQSKMNPGPTPAAVVSNQ